MKLPISPIRSICLPALLLPVVSGFLLGVSTAPVHADVFLLEDGGQVTGKVIERGDERQYVVETTHGAIVTLAKDQVRDIERQSEHQQEYLRRSRSLPDTVAAHRSMAGWCKERDMSDLADHHLRRILAIEPDNQAARASLGYRRHRGRWVTREELMAERGLTFYDGSYRTAQDIALREREKQQTAAKSEWYRQIRLWRGWLVGSRTDRASEAADKIRAIADPAAAEGLIKVLERESNERIRDLLIATLAQINHPDAINKLVELSLYDPDRHVRLDCLDYLLNSRHSLPLTPYVKALRSKDNEVVNRAADALRQVGNPEAISPLIDALVTSHKFANPDAAPGDIGASFSPSGGGGGGLNMNAPKVIRADLRNVEVRRALVELSGDQDFGFSKRAWRRWYVNREMRSEFVDTRRDE